VTNNFWSLKLIVNEIFYCNICQQYKILELV